MESINPAAVIDVVEKKKEECVKKQWVLYTNKSGEKILVRDVLSKMCDWLDRFKSAGDTIVDFDPAHAAIPWIIVKTLLQVCENCTPQGSISYQGCPQIAVNDCQIFGKMVESLEVISSIVTRYTEAEARVLIRTSNLTNQLSAAIVKLYGSSLRFLAQAYRYYGQNTLSKISVTRIFRRLEKCTS